MKKILLGILALAAVACNNDVVISEQTSSAITFGDSFVEVKTRATEDPSTTTETINAFDVWAFINNDPTGTVFNQERVKRVNGVWQYTNTQWWAQSKSYDFFAVSPVDDANIVVDNSTMDQYGLGNIAFTNVDGTTDLLYSALELKTTQEFPYYNDVVNLQFMHLLSKIKFTFKNGFTSENQTLKVTNIMIEDAPAEGNIDVNKQQRTDYAWVLTQGKNTELSFGYANDDVAIACGQSGSSQYERLTIPADANRTYKISFDLELFNGTQSGMTSHKEVTLTNQAFEIGKNYNLVATIDASNFSEQALKPIVFDNIEVEEWNPGDFNGNLDWDNDQNNPSNPSEPVASEWALVGAFSSWADKTMLTTADADVVVLEDVALKAAEGFLVRKPSTDWADKYGAGNVNYLKANHYITTVKDGADMCVEADGTYDVYFNISTKNLYVMEADANYAEATEQTVNGEEPKQEEPEVTEKVVYLKPNANWTTDGARFAAYFWNDSANAWVSMTAIEGGIYQVNLPEGYDYGCSVIFCRMNPNTTANNWNNKWNQTGDLKVPTDGKNLFTLAESAWDGATTSWSVYTPAVAKPVALATPVVTTEVDVNVVTLTWEAIEGASHYTVQVDDDVEEVVNDTTYIFNGDYEVEYTFTVKAIAADTTKNLDSEAAIVKATTEAEPVVGPTYTTVAEFLAAEVNDTTFYTLKGTITAVANTSYGNFDLTDDTGTVYVYGLYSEDGSTSKYWAASGAQIGDDIVISAKRAEFGGNAQAGSARFVELTSPGTRAFWSFSKEAVVFGSAASEQNITVDAYNLSGDVTVSSDNTQFTASYANGVLTISAEENTTPDVINGNITVASGSLVKVITVAQNGVSVGGGTEVSASAVMAEQGWANSASVKEVSLDDNVTVKFAQGKASNPPAYYTSGNAVRLYQNGATMTVSANGKTIKSIEIEFSQSHYYMAPNCGDFSAEGDTRVWTGEATEIIFTTTGTDKNHRAYISAIKVTYIE